MVWGELEWPPGPTKTCQTLRTIKDGGGREQKINPVHYLQPTSYQVTSLRENIINLPTNNSGTPQRRAEQSAPPLRRGKDGPAARPGPDPQKHVFTHNGKYYSRSRSWILDGGG